MDDASWFTLNADQWLPVAAAMSLGAFVSLLAWWLARRMVVPPSVDDDYRDPPPIAFRSLWWLIAYSEPFFDNLQSGSQRGALLDKLRRAGFEYSLTPAQFSAAQFAFALAVAVVTGLLFMVLSLTQPGEGPSMQGGLSLWSAVMVVAVLAFAAWALPLVWLHDRIVQRRREFLLALPFFLDIITLCVEAGLNVQGAITQAVAKGPRGYLRDEFQRVLREIRSGKARAEALRDLSDRVKQQSLSNFTSCIIQAERMGMTLGPMLRAQGEQRLNERFMRAEKLALEAPVKMLFPLIACIFPCTFVVLLFPIVVRVMGSGL